MSNHREERFDRRSMLVQAPSVELWPAADPSHLPAHQQRSVELLSQALWDFFTDGDTSVAEILRRYPVARTALYRAARRCLAKHADGRIYGFRAALPYVRIKDYERQAAVKPLPYARAGSAGAFRQLFRDFPTVQQVVDTAVRNRNKRVKPGGQVRQPIRHIHTVFITACRDAGITADRYPLNTKRLGFRALGSYVKKIVERDFAMAVSHAGGRKTNALPGPEEQAPAATRAFEIVEFDGHKIDLRLTVSVPDPFGMEQSIELHRVWILVLLDVYTRAVIGYHIALGKEYNKDDVAAALQSALSPAVPRQYCIPELSVRPDGGFPSALIPETAFACWDWFRMDGAKSHLAGDTLRRLNQIVGCWTDNGPPADPNVRPFIERFFHLIARHFAHRLPGTVGSSPDSIERALSDPKGDARLYVELPELEDMIHVLLANYNATVHSGVGGKTPLEAMAYSVTARKGFLRTLPMPIRSNLCLMQEARVVTIKGSTVQGTRPHINFIYVRYTSPVLASNAALIGRKLRIYYDVRDLRAVKAFFEDGTELGVLSAARPWNITPHSLRVRQEIHRLIEERKLDISTDDCPVAAWARYKWKKIKTSKRAANDLAKAQANGALPRLAPSLAINAAPTAAAAPVPVQQEPAPVPAEDAPVKPTPMQIRRTITF